jgi:RNA polymerase sigma-70 factor (ECF subfamily)
MEAVAASDPRAQTVVAERLTPRVRRLCRLLCRSAADADDAAQVSLIEILRSASTFPGCREPRALGRPNHRG